MTMIDLKSSESIANEITNMKKQLDHLKSKKQIEMDEITDDEDDENDNNEIIENNEEEQEVEEEQEPDEQNYLEELPNDNKINKNIEIDQEQREIIPRKTMDLKKYTKKEIKMLLSAFDVNITRIIKKYKSVDDLSEDELIKIQNKFDNEYKFFNKKSSKLLNKLSNYDDLDDAEYNKLNNKIKQISNKFNNFIKEFIDYDENDDSEQFEFSD
tara:strand:- start:225 stop:863 length:639 start_codon:yes stop_codon:yes gene_type:complete